MRNQMPEFLRLPGIQAVEQEGVIFAIVALKSW